MDECKAMHLRFKTPQTYCHLHVNVQSQLCRRRNGLRTEAVNEANTWYDKQTDGRTDGQRCDSYTGVIHCTGVGSAVSRQSKSGLVSIVGDTLFDLKCSKAYDTHSDVVVIGVASYGALGHVPP